MEYQKNNQPNRLRRTLVTALASLPLLSAAWSAQAKPMVQSALNPNGSLNTARTWFFGVTLTEWADSATWAPFPKEGRRDFVLRDTFVKLGVPASQIFMIADRAATRERIRTQLHGVLRKTMPGDFLWFSYQGHGDKRQRGGMFMVPYDTDASSPKTMKATAYKLSDLLDDIESGFHGSHVILSGDCCHSGQMVRVAPHRNGRIAFGAIASSLSSEVSTGNWTFTNALIDGLSGQNNVDLNHDGIINLSEIARYAQHVMAFEEEQLSTFGFGKNFPKEMVVARVANVANSASAAGKQVEVLRHSAWQKAVVIDARNNGDMKVRLAKKTDPLKHWFSSDSVREYVPKKISKGTRVEVKLKGRWVNATVEAEHLGIHHVRFSGEMEDDDEWVSSRRIRLPG